MSIDREELTVIRNKDLYMSMYASQLILAVIGIIISFFVSGGPLATVAKLHFNWWDGLWQGAIFAACALTVNGLLYWLFPKKWLDDGGLNERVFANMGRAHILVFCSIVAFCEEWLFRGVIQQAFGLPIASFLFALVHFRYVKKPVLFLYVLTLSIALGVLFQETGNFAAVVMAHLLINAILGFILRRKQVG